jgi:hypothetical protein
MQITKNEVEPEILKREEGSSLPVDFYTENPFVA